jgi:hypothetical protein
MWSRICVCVGLGFVGMGGGGLAQAASSWSGGADVPVGPQRMMDSGAAEPATAGESSSLGTPEVKAAVALTPRAVKNDPTSGSVRPFSSVAFGTSSGTLGLGGQVATPVTRWLNLRGGIDFFNYGYSLGIDGANYEGQLHLKAGRVSLDIFPFHRGFHLSPGVMIFRSAASAAVSVTGGNTFELGGNTFTSSASDPVNGSASLAFSRTVMPMFTFGFSNMIAKGRRHWTVPLELGAAYTGPYSARLNLGGSACIDQVGCMSTSTPEIQQSVVEEQREINEPMKHYQLYPIVILGIGYKF